MTTLEPPRTCSETQCCTVAAPWWLNGVTAASPLTRAEILQFSRGADPSLNHLLSGPQSKVRSREESQPLNIWTRVCPACRCKGSLAWRTHLGQDKSRRLKGLRPSL